MAHFIFFVGYTDPIPDGHVPDSTEYTLLWKQVYASINGDGGGTWAPSAFITVGGSGFQLTGTGHKVASGGKLTIADGATLKADGGGADIILGVSSSVATLDVKSGAAIIVRSGGSEDMYGSYTVQSGGTNTVASGGLENVASGGEFRVSSGGQANFYGATGWNLYGTGSVQNGGTLAILSGGAVSSHGTITHQSDAVEVYINGATRSGIVQDASRIVRTGSGGRTAYRPAVNLSGSADSDLTVANDRYNVPSALTNNRIYTIRHTGTVPVAGERIMVSRMSPTAPSTLYSAKIAREDGTVLMTFGASREGFAEFEFDGTSWQLIAGVQTTVGTSGYYDDVWV